MDFALKLVLWAVQVVLTLLSAKFVRVSFTISKIILVFVALAHRLAWLAHQEAVLRVSTVIFCQVRVNAKDVNPTVESAYLQTNVLRFSTLKDLLWSIWTQLSISLLHVTLHVLLVQAQTPPFAHLAFLVFTYKLRNIACLVRKTAFAPLAQQLMLLFVSVASLDISWLAQFVRSVPFLAHHAWVAVPAFAKHVLKGTSSSKTQIFVYQTKS